MKNNPFSDSSYQNSHFLLQREKQLTYHEHIWMSFLSCHLARAFERQWRFSSVQSLSLVRLFATPWIAARQASLSITPGVHSDSRPSRQWCHPAISSSVAPFSSCPQFLPASESFPVSQLFAWGGQSTGVSALASFLPKTTQGWSPLAWTGWISLQMKNFRQREVKWVGLLIYLVNGTVFLWIQVCLTLNIYLCIIYRIECL